MTFVIEICNYSCSFSWNLRLLRAAEEALIEGSEKHLEIVEEITNDHLNAARSVIKNKEILLHLESQLRNECLKLRSFLEAAEV